MVMAMVVIMVMIMIDYLVLYIAGTCLHIKRVLPAAVLGLSSRLIDLGLEVASKSRIISSSRDLSRSMRVLLGEQGLKVQDAPVASDLGLDQRCGRKGPRPKAKQAACKALVALLKATAWGAWHALASAASNAGTAGPWVRKSLRKQSKTACSSAAVMVCRP